MVKQKSKVISLICAVALVFSLMSVAFARASDQLDQYRISLSSKNGGKIYITCYVCGTGIMDEIGVEKVVVKEKYNNIWIPTFSFTGGSTSGHVSYSETFEYDGVEGNEYLIEATVFAENEDGYDTGVVSKTITV